MRRPYRFRLVLYLYSQIDMWKTAPMTVLELYSKLSKAIMQWHGNKYCFTADDVEWNAYHWMYFGLETNPDEIKSLDDNQCIEYEWYDYNQVVIVW